MLRRKKRPAASKTRKTICASKALKPGTRRLKGRVVPKKGHKFVKNGGGRTVKVKAKR